MDNLSVIKENHKAKSNKVKKLERKLKNKAKNTIPLELLQNLLKREEESSINPRDYMYDGDDTWFLKDEAKKEARMELLKELISTQMEKQREREVCWRK